MYGFLEMSYIKIIGVLGGNMINFNEEIKKYKPVLTISEVSEQVENNYTEDILEIFQFIKNSSNDEE